MISRALLAGVLALLSCSAAGAPSPRAAISKSATEWEASPADNDESGHLTQHTIRVALNHPAGATAELHDRAVAAARGQADFMTLEELRAFVGSPPSVLQHFKTWWSGATTSVCGHSARPTTAVGPTHDYIYLSASVSCVGAVFNTTMMTYTHTRSPQTQVVRADGAVPPRGLRTGPSAWARTVPGWLAHRVHSVTGLDDLPPLATRPDGSLAGGGGGASGAVGDSSGARTPSTEKSGGGSGDPGDKITPAVIWKQYGIPAPPLAEGGTSKHAAPPPADAVAVNSNFDREFNAAATTTAAADRARVATGGQAVGEFESQFFLPSDISKFQGAYGVPITPIAIVGPNNPSSGPAINLDETSLDLEYISGVGTGISTTMVSVPASKGFDLVSWAQSVTLGPNQALVHSLSWGGPEHGMDVGFLQRGDAELAKLAVQGYTVVVSSGDNGPNANSDGNGCGQFTPMFPASSPNVLAVGGTVLTGDNQTCWNGSGGGFSTVFKRPQWQEAVVKEYLTMSGLPDRSIFNVTGRVTPDVSGFATNYQTIVQGKVVPNTGTSASAPMFAGLLSRISTARLARHGRPLGLVAPLLYDISAAHGGLLGMDITVGKSKSYGGCEQGWPATQGFDACSGLGTPIYNILFAGLVNSSVAL